jgi:hypothetical protein
MLMDKAYEDILRTIASIFTSSKSTNAGIA